MIIAVYHNYFEVVKLLLEKGANPDHRDCFAKKAIDRAKNPDMVSLLQKGLSRSRSASRNSQSRLASPLNSSNATSRTFNRASTPQKYLMSPRRPSTSMSQYSRPSTPSKTSIEPFKRRELKTQAETHLKSQVQKFQKSIEKSWFESLENSLFRHLESTQELLHKKIENMLTKSSREMVGKLQEFLELNLEETIKKSETPSAEVSNIKVEDEFTVEDLKPRYQHFDSNKELEESIYRARHNATSEVQKSLNLLNNELSSLIDDLVETKIKENFVEQPRSLRTSHDTLNFSEANFSSIEMSSPVHFSPKKSVSWKNPEQLPKDTGMSSRLKISKPNPEVPCTNVSATLQKFLTGISS